MRDFMDANQYEEYQKILGVTMSDTLVDIKKKYRELLKINHPDINKSPEAIKISQEITAAYDYVKKYYEEYQSYLASKNNYNSEVKRAYSSYTKKYTTYENHSYRNEVNNIIMLCSKMGIPEAIAIICFVFIKKYSKEEKQLIKWLQKRNEILEKYKKLGILDIVYKVKLGTNSIGDSVLRDAAKKMMIIDLCNEMDIPEHMIMINIEYDTNLNEVIEYLKYIKKLSKVNKKGKTYKKVSNKQ